MASSIHCNFNSIINSNLVANPNTPNPCSLRQDFPVQKSGQFVSSNLSSASQEKRFPLDIVTSSAGVRLSGAWREIHGSNNWEDMVEPLDPLLRQEIVRYGDFVMGSYKAFDLDPVSKRYLNCKYGKGSMLREVGLGDSGYRVTNYVYATALDVHVPIQMGSSSSARWIGYVAVSGDKQVASLGRRDIVVAFRGTVTSPEWMANLMSSLTPANFDPLDPMLEVKVEQGFLSLYTSSETHCKFGLRSCRDQLLSEIYRLLHEYKDEEVSITIAGHSMGSSLGLLLAYDLAELGLNWSRKGSEEEIPVTVFSFGGPRVGNLGFKVRCEELGVKVLRVVNLNDPIPKLPGILFNEHFMGFKESCSCYAHVGVELVVDFFNMNKISCVHDLEDYIGCLKGLEIYNFEEGKNGLMERAKGFLLGSGLGFEGLQWKDSAMNMMNLFQSQWT